MDQECERSVHISAASSAGDADKLTKFMGGGHSNSPLTPSDRRRASTGDLCETPRHRRGRKKREFTKTQERIIRYIADETLRRGEAAVSKRELAEIVGCHRGTVDRLVSDLKSRGVIEEKPRFDASGGQLANAYRIADSKVLTRGHSA